jgi:hypothetical protein
LLIFLARDLLELDEASARSGIATHVLRLTAAAIDLKAAKEIPCQLLLLNHERMAPLNQSN